MANVNRPNGFKPYGRVKQAAAMQCGSTVAMYDAVTLNSSGQVETATDASDLFGVALQAGSANDNIMVSVDADQLYLSQADEADIDAQTDIGNCCNILSTASSSVYKHSRHQIDSSTIRVDGGQLMIVRVGPRMNNAAGSKAEVIVKICQPQAFGNAGFSGI